MEGHFHVPKETSRQACGDGQINKIKEGYRYIADTSPAVVVTPHVSDNESDRPYRLHPQHGQTCESSWDSAGENISRSPEVSEVIHAMNVQGFKEVRRTRGGHTQTQQTRHPKVLSNNNNKKLERLTEDIVQRNKITLGRNTSKCSSYVTAHALKQETPHNVNKVRAEHRV